MRTLYLCLAAVVLSIAAEDALSIEPLSAEELKEICSETDAATSDPGARLCAAYVNGFLDGAVATDGRVAENVASEFDEDESFSERAIRTRIVDRLDRFGPSVYAEFCVGQPDPIADVIGHVIEELELYDDLSGIQAQAVVYASLRCHYPCRNEES